MPWRNLPASTGRPSAASGARSSSPSGAPGGEGRDRGAFPPRTGVSACFANESLKVQFLSFALILPKSWPRFPLPLGDAGGAFQSEVIPFHPLACPIEHSSAPARALLPIRDWAGERLGEASRAGE